MEDGSDRSTLGCRSSVPSLKPGAFHSPIHQESPHNSTSRGGGLPRNQGDGSSVAAVSSKDVLPHGLTGILFLGNPGPTRFSGEIPGAINKPGPANWTPRMKAPRELRRLSQHSLREIFAPCA